MTHIRFAITRNYKQMFFCLLEYAKKNIEEFSSPGYVMLMFMAYNCGETHCEDCCDVYKTTNKNDKKFVYSEGSCQLLCASCVKSTECVDQVFEDVEIAKLKFLNPTNCEIHYKNMCELIVGCESGRDHDWSFHKTVLG